MTFTERSLPYRLLCAAIAAVSLVSCSSATKGPGGTITKVKPYFLDPLVILRTPDPAILFEREHHLRGAYTAAEQAKRTGSYYTIMWKVKDRSQPVTVRFEYRQSEKALQVMKLEQEVTNVRRHNTTKFAVIGNDYNDVQTGTPAVLGSKVTGGRVSAWRVTLLRGNEELATQQSYLWK